MAAASTAAAGAVPRGPRNAVRSFLVSLVVPAPRPDRLPVKHRRGPGAAPRRTSGQDGLAAEKALTVTLLSHSAKTPSVMAIWCEPAPGTPITSVGKLAGVAPETQ